MTTTAQAPLTKAQVEARLLKVNAEARHMQHHPDNAVWVAAHRRLNALLTAWQATQR